ncbi:MAG: hypothetical protein IT534_10405 [Bauldia sp.]|nr:hypothetical protein [Bauldia sp.]
MGEMASKELSLWRAVISQAISDASSKANDRQSQIARAAARRWFRFRGEDFLEACALAGLEPDKVRAFALEKIGEPASGGSPSSLERKQRASRGRPITHNGETRSLDQWAAHLGINRNTLYARLTKLGWSVEAALTADVDPTSQRRRGRARNFQNKLGDRRGEQRAIPSANGDFAP